MSQEPSQQDLEQVEKLRTAYTSMKEEIKKVIVGQDHVVDELFMALFCRGHCLLIGVPGLAKTLLISTLSRVLSLDFNRIQFTPDLMPTDITGTEVIQDDKASGTREFKFLPGPIFANVILADEINRTPPKTQAALLEAMQERRVTLDGETHVLPDRFMVIATQNPIESQGVYPLPEAQLDRFLFKLLAEYPSEEEEANIVARFGAQQGPPRPESLGVEAVTTREALQQSIASVSAVTLAPENVEYVVRLVRATRGHADLATGASPRAAVLLGNAARVRAALEGRDYVVPDDIKALATGVLRHRLILSAAAEIEGREVEAIVGELIESTQAPR